MIEQNYDWISNISQENFRDKSVILVGTGPMAREYAIAFTKMGISDVTVISKSDKETTDFSNSFDFTVLHGGYQEYLLLHLHWHRQHNRHMDPNQRLRQECRGCRRNRRHLRHQEVVG